MSAQCLFSFPQTRCSRLLGAIVLALYASACGGGGGGNSTVTGPSPSTPTRIANVTGNLAFGDVPVGSTREATFTITNAGNATLTVSSLGVSGGLASITTASWTSGTIVAGGSQAVTVRVTPTTSGAFSGTVTVNGDQTSGSNSLPISGNATVSFTGTWAGANVVSACNGTGSAQDLICSDARGAFKRGSRLIFRVTLTQTGNSVTGTADLAGTVGPVTGTVTGGTLTLTGTLRDNVGFTSVITSWNTSLSGASMVGSLGYSVTFTNVPGNAIIVADLSGVTRQ